MESVSLVFGFELLSIELHVAMHKTDLEMKDVVTQECLCACICMHVDRHTAVLADRQH